MLIVLGTASCAVALHCGFPEPMIESGVVETEGGPATSDVDAANDAPTPLPPDVDPSGKEQDAETRDDVFVPRPDAGPDAPTGGCGNATADPCDCDGDKSKNHSPGCAPPLPEKPDCDDYDKLVSPKQASFIASTQWDSNSPVPLAFDWNCDGTVTKQFPYDVKCSLANCAKTEGFSGNPGCGQPGEYIFCEELLLPIGLICQVNKGKTQVRIQGCK